MALATASAPRTPCWTISSTRVLRMATNANSAATKEALRAIKAGIASSPRYCKIARLLSLPGASPRIQEHPSQNKPLGALNQETVVGRGSAYSHVARNEDSIGMSHALFTSTGNAVKEFFPSFEAFAMAGDHAFQELEALAVKFITRPRRGHRN